MLQTGGGNPLVSDRQVLQYSGVSSPILSFDFGFATQETPVPNEFLDSFTVSVQDSATDLAVLFTADASGVTWVPSTPGAFTLQDSDVQFSAITPPGQEPVSGQGVAFTVDFPIPAQFQGSSVTVFFDLADNLDENMSLGWYRNLQITTVPEPSSFALGALGITLLAFARKYRR